MSRPKRMLHVLHTLSPGGCEYMLLLLLPALKKQGWEVTIATLGPGGPLRESFEQIGIPVRENLFHFLSDIGGLFRLRKLVKETNPGLVVAHLFYADLLARLLPKFFLGVPMIPLIHSTYRVPSLWKIRLFERLSAWTLRHCLVVSPAVKTSELQYGLKASTAYVVPNPVDTDLFHPISQAQRLELRQRYGYSSDARIIVCVANFIDYKRHIDLLKAFVLAQQKIPFLELILVGTGPEEAKLRSFVTTHKLDAWIHFVGNYLGERRKVAETVQLSDVFALPSLFEGMCTAIMEAMAAGIPVIASNIPENRILIPDASLGLLVPVRNPDVLARALIKLFSSSDDLSLVGERARNHMVTHFSLPIITQEWAAVYKALSN